MLTSLLLTVLSIAQAPNADDLERLSMEYRRAVIRGHVTFRSDLKGPHATRITHGAIWFDGANYRSDIFFPYEGDSRFANGLAPPAGETHYRETRCVTEDEYISYSAARLSDGAYSAVNLQEPSERSREYFAVPDPRLIGVFPESMARLIHFDLGFRLANAGWKAMGVESVQHENADCWLVKYSHPNGGKYQKWFEPGKGYSVVRVEAKSPPGDDMIVDTLVCTLSKDEASGIWFPSATTYQRTTGGKPTESEELTVEVVSLNEPIADETFELAGIEIPICRNIDRRPRDARGMLYWDGEAVVAVSPPRVDPMSGARRRWMWIAVSLALALITFSLIWRSLKNRPKPRAA